VQTISTMPSCIHIINSCHISDQRDPTACLEDFLACPHAASVASRARCFSAFTMRGWIVLIRHVATIHGMYAGKHGGYSLHPFFFLLDARNGDGRMFVRDTRTYASPSWATTLWDSGYCYILLPLFTKECNSRF
jgi:hypothetical protein